MEPQPPIFTPMDWKSQGWTEATDEKPDIKPETLVEVQWESGVTDVHQIGHIGIWSAVKRWRLAK